jgi:hypothetical protein
MLKDIVCSVTIVRRACSSIVRAAPKAFGVGSNRRLADRVFPDDRFDVSRRNQAQLAHKDDRF